MGLFREFVGTACFTYGQSNTTIINSLQMSLPARTTTRPAEERDTDGILEMVRQEHWTVPTERMLMDNLRHGVVWVTTDDEDRVLSKWGGI